MNKPNFNSLIDYTFFVLLFGLVVRAMTLGQPDLIDSTEGRYATIAQDMAINNNWGEPEIRMYGEIESYMGKPPLHFWITAISIKIFGMNEWAVRLPSFVSSIITILVICIFAKRFFDLQLGLVSSCILITSGLFFFLSGACLLDTTLSACISCALVGIAFFLNQAETSKSNSSVILAAFSIGIGFLIKGPVIIILVFGTLISWLLLSRQLHLLRKIPWISFVIVILLVIMPWFIYQEYENPGFLKYFFINENLKRYLIEDYGDRYGSGHSYYLGMSWLMLLLSFMPWTLFFLRDVIYWFKNRTFGKKSDPTESRILLFCVIWGIFPALFFSFSKQLTATYLLSGLPGLALYIGYQLSRADSDSLKRYRYISDFLLIAVILTAIGFSITGFVVSAPITNFNFGLLVGITVIFINIYALKNRNDRLLNSRIAFLSLSIVMVYLSFIVNLTEYISTRRSTNVILEEIRNDPELQNNTVAILFGNPFSANFYGRRDPNLPLEIKWLIQEEAVAQRIPNIILRQSDFKLLNESTKKMYSIRETRGPWVWLKIL